MTMIDITPFGGTDIAVVNADEVFLKDVDTANQLCLTVKLQGGTNLIAINQEAFPSKFFDPATGFPQNILNRLQQNNVKMAVVGDFSSYGQSSFMDFMAQCNNGFHLFFVSNDETAGKRLLAAVEDDKKFARS